MSVVAKFRTLSLFSFAFALCVTHSATSRVWGCPNCKEGLLDNGQAGINLARGFELSIYVMLGAPLLVLGLLGFVFYLQIRSAKRNGNYPDMEQVIARIEADRLSTSP